MSDLYRLTKTQMVEGSMHAMNGGTYMGHLVSVTIDYEAATTKLVKLLRLMGFESPVEMAKAMEVGAVGIVDAALGGNE